MVLREATASLGSSSWSGASLGHAIALLMASAAPSKWSFAIGPSSSAILLFRANQDSLVAVGGDTLGASFGASAGTGMVGLARSNVSANTQGSSSNAPTPYFSFHSSPKAALRRPLVRDSTLRSANCRRFGNDFSSHSRSPTPSWQASSSVMSLRRCSRTSATVRVKRDPQRGRLVLGRRMAGWLRSNPCLKKITSSRLFGWTRCGRSGQCTSRVR